MAHKTTVNNVELYWEKTGDSGEPLVLVHGSWDDHHTWDFIVPILSKSLQVLTYDRRGHSQSERSSSPHTITDDVNDLAALIEESGLAPVHLSGQSFGGAVALRLAVQRPDLLRSLHVHAPPLLHLLRDDPEEQALFQGLTEHLNSVEKLLAAGDMEGGARQFVGGPDTWAAMPEEIKQIMIANAHTFLDDLHDPEAFSFNLDQLRSFPHPVLLTDSENDMPFAHLVVSKLSKVLPHVERQHFSDADHDAQLSQPEAYAHSIHEFIVRISDRQG
jgi:pimeloyl-ACP methyl ester carboxylesterase